MTTPKAIPKPRTIYYVRKDTQKEYSLMEMEVLADRVTIDRVLHRDLAMIVYAKLFQKLKEQKVGSV